MISQQFNTQPSIFGNTSSLPLFNTPVQYNQTSLLQMKSLFLQQQQQQNLLIEQQTNSNSLKQQSLCFQKPQKLQKKIIKKKSSKLQRFIYQCDICPQTFTQLFNMHNHIKNIHEVNPHLCQLCHPEGGHGIKGVTAFSHVRELKMHTKKVHHGKTLRVKRDQKIFLSEKEFLLRTQPQNQNQQNPLKISLDNNNNQQSTVSIEKDNSPVSNSSTLQQVDFEQIISENEECESESENNQEQMLKQLKENCFSTSIVIQQKINNLNKIGEVSQESNASATTWWTQAEEQNCGFRAIKSDDFQLNYQVKQESL